MVHIKLDCSDGEASFRVKHQGVENQLGTFMGDSGGGFCFWRAESSWCRILQWWVVGRMSAVIHSETAMTEWPLYALKSAMMLSSSSYE